MLGIARLESAPGQLESVLALSNGAADARQMPGKVDPRNHTVLLDPRLHGFWMASLAPELIPLKVPFEMGFPLALTIPA